MKGAVPRASRYRRRRPRTVPLMSERDRSEVDAHNRAVYESDAVVREFTELRTLFPVEDQLFDRYVPAGVRVLDLGVGGGRTTAALRTAAATTSRSTTRRLWSEAVGRLTRRPM